MPRTATKHPAVKRWVAVSGLRLLVRTWGEPRDRPVLYWHGLSYTSRGGLELNQAGPHLASRYDLYVVALDVPGFAGSPPLAPEAYHPRSLIDLVPPLLDALELERVAFIGSSWGGHIGCHVAAHHADRLTGLVLLDSGYRDPWYDRSLPFETLLAESERAWEAQRASSWDAIVTDMRARQPGWSASTDQGWQAGWRAAEDGVVPAISPTVVAAATYGIAQEPPSTTWPELVRTDLPTLLMAAGDAQEDELAQFTRAVPHAVVQRASGIGHNILADGGPAVLATIGEWLHELSH